MDWPIHRIENGLFAVVLRPCTLALTALFLPESDAIVWLRGYRPNPYVEWWMADVPLDRKSSSTSVQVRDLVFDIQLPVSRFREFLPILDDHGVELHLMDRPVPDTLTLDGVSEAQQSRILTANGLIASFHLPHADEIAQLEAPERDTLERWLEETDLSDWLESANR